MVDLFGHLGAAETSQNWHITSEDKNDYESSESELKQ